jgi:tripartite-type tricarboxylate transporter receptor subunit TctC
MIFVRALAAALSPHTRWRPSALAQTYPDRPVIVIVAFPPGGADDGVHELIFSNYKAYHWAICALPAQALCARDIV